MLITELLGLKWLKGQCLHVPMLHVGVLLMTKKHKIYIDRNIKMIMAQFC